MKTVTFSDEARAKLKKGVDLITDAVKVTLGPRGRNVVYGWHYGYPVCTKDGVTVARQVEAIDQTEQMGLLLLRQVAQKTADDAGDGTTTACILARGIFSEGIKCLQSGGNPILIKKGIDQAVIQVISFIKEYNLKFIKHQEAITAAELKNVASLSANNDYEIGALIADAVQKIGEEGVITIEDNAQGPETYIELLEGMQLNEGLLSPYFITDPVKMEAIHQNPWIMIVDGEISNIVQIKALMEKALATGRPVVLVAQGMQPTVMQGLIQAKMKSDLPVAIVKAPYFGDYRTEQLVDLGILTGGRVIGYSTGIKPEDAELLDLGQCGSVKATRYFTTFTDGKGAKEKIAGRIEMIKSMIEKSESDYEKEKLRERLSKLTSGVAVIKVGAPTEVEQKEKKMRVEDALLATKAAIEEGVVPGGGLILLLASLRIVEEGTEEEITGQRIVKKALKDPIRQIAENAGIEGSEIIAAILRAGDGLPNFGYDFLNNKFGDLVEMGIIDPVKVVRLALQNAASVAGLLLTTEVIINEDVEAEVVRTPKPKSA